MQIHTNIPLPNYTTMRLGGNARFMAPVTSPDEVAMLYQNAQKQNLSVFVLGGGSNVIAHDEGFDGIVLLNRIKGFDVVSDDKSTAVIRVGAGEVWDEVVERAVGVGLSGIETMSAIPGTAGAAPVQNIGAYGQELSDTLESVEAYDTVSDKMVLLSAEDCKLSYRHSIFRGEAAGRYCITAVSLRLFRASPQPPFYAGLQRYFDENSITIYTPEIIRKAVMAIREEKLPNPVERPNSGSFFKNAIIESWQFEDLKNQYPDMPSFDMPNSNYKIPTGWLIEQTGLKGQLLHGMRVHDKNALVLINESASSYADLAEARSEIIQAVYDKFRIQIEQEPLELTKTLR
ncbi:UDP-N-acetylenolpyruvoylglucosamine reductase [Candidatus Saccharibacteria bacterium 32-49-12]|nr:MAG: UDP-N-acetylenolpyruvoylglucosamine reductase [Candidatus Saccharibacteria bacterium 32-49-12]